MTLHSILGEASAARAIASAIAETDACVAGISGAALWREDGARLPFFCPTRKLGVKPGMRGLVEGDGWHSERWHQS